MLSELQTIQYFNTLIIEGGQEEKISQLKRCKKQKKK